MIIIKMNTGVSIVRCKLQSRWWRCLCVALLTFALVTPAASQGTRLLRQPTISARNIAFVYGGDLWIADLNGGYARRLTSTPAVESNPHFSPDGRWIAFTSNRSGMEAAYIVTTDGGTPTRLTWYPAPAWVRGWTPDGKRILYASPRETAPVSYDRLWTVDARGGPSTLVPAPFGTPGSFAPDGKRIIIDRVRRWDTEWRGYRGGQNTPLTILNLEDLSEKQLPNEITTDTQPVWINDMIYFLSDRDWITNIWCYAPLVAFIRHRADLTYVLDQMNGELSVGHSFVFGGDFPRVSDYWARILWLKMDTGASNAFTPRRAGIQI